MLVVALVHRGARTLGLRIFLIKIFCHHIVDLLAAMGVVPCLVPDNQPIHEESLKASRG